MSSSLPYRTHESDATGRGDESEEDEEDFDETGYKTVKDAILFAIEVSSSMLENPPPSTSKKADTNSPLLATLKCAYRLMQQRIISNPRDLMGILLYGTETTKFYDEENNSTGGYSFPHCYLLTDLNVPEAEDVKLLKALVEDGLDSKRSAFIPSNKPVSMHTVLFCANQIFAQRAPNFTTRRLFLVTDNDNPHADDKGLRNNATTRAKDLYDLGVQLELFPISSSSHTFDTKLFYDDIIYRSTPSDPDAVVYNPTSFIDSDDSNLKAGSTDGISLLESLLSNISSKFTPKRALFSSVALEIAPSLRISVKGYILYKRQEPARSCYVYLGSDRPLIVTGSTTLLADDSGATVEKVEVRKAFKFGGEEVVFAPEEIKELRNFGEPVIRIIGFKPASSLPSWANIKHSVFIYPSEEDYVGGTRLFSALHQKLLKSKVFALTWYLARKNAAPVIAALIPTLPADNIEANANPAGVSATGCPQGLHLITLPFANDIRQKPATAPEMPIIAPDKLVDAMQLIVKQLNLPKSIYDPSKYPSPSLQWHYRVLQALALDEDLPSHPEDKTVPKYKQIDKRVGFEATEWKTLLEEAVTEHRQINPGDLTSPSPKKRVAKADGAETKRQKRESGNGVDEAAMRNLWKENKIGTLTVADLKDFCSANNLLLSGKKADLVDRIEGFFERK